MTVRQDDFLHILVIDDEVEIRSLIADAMHAEGHLVITAASAEEGLEQLPYYTFEVAFLDHHLPGMEGLVLGEYLRANNPNMEIALVTGGADDRVGRIAAAHDIQLIAKPFEVEQLLSVVERYQAVETGRKVRAQRESRDDYRVSVARHHAHLAEYFGLPGVPRRIEELIIRRVQAALSNLRLGREFSDRDRAGAYAGLLAAQVLGLRLPKNKSGVTMFQEYDRLMLAHDRAPAFGAVQAE